VDAPIAGRVVADHLRLGATVKQGDVVVELDSALEARRLTEEQTRRAALRPQLEAMHRAILAEEAALTEGERSTRTALEQAETRSREAETVASFAASEAARYAKLREQRLVPDAETMKVRSESDKQRANAEAVRLDVLRLANERRSRASEARSHVEQLRRDAAVLEGELTTADAAVQVLNEDIERHKVRAPIDGRLGDVAALAIGSVVAAGERMATIVPEGQLRVIASYPPAAAIGRIRRGQKGRLRLEGFPSVQYGTLGVEVDAVAAELRDGAIRVDLRVLPDASSAITLEHGLPGSVEIEIERVSPAVLMLRAAGRLVSKPTVSGG
jgi:membrane fusion protein (multidrug efflux system)